MKIVSTSYIKTGGVDNPQDWLEKISFYTGMLEQLSGQHEVTSMERIDYEGEYTKNGVCYRFIKLKKKKVLFPWRMHRLIKRMKPDIVFVNGFVFPLQIIQLRFSIGKAARIIVLHRAERPFKGWKKYLQKLADSCVNAYLFASSEFGKEWIQDNIISDQRKIYEVMQVSSSFYPEDKNAARAKLSITGDPVFLWVGRLDANKDPLTVVKAFIQFLSFQPAAKLYMVYQTEELLAGVNDMIRTNSRAAEAIRLAGRIPHTGIADWYNSADYIISGSHYEGGSIAVSEAMSCGCIPVVTDIVSFRRMTGPGKCGFLYEPGNDKELLSVLLQTRYANIETERLKVLQQFREELSFEAIARKINVVITGL